LLVGTLVFSVARKSSLHQILYTYSLIFMFISHAVSSNVSEVPGRFARRFGTRELAQAAYDQALDTGQVIEVTYTISKRPLSRPAA
jgi:hypothetical protein